MNLYDMGGIELASILFWNKPPTRDLTRAADPLGFDALREAIADTLVPLLTGATRDADEYLWTLVGLRWANHKTGSSVDATIFDQGFKPFERALKQYWYKFHGRTSGGINVVKKLCEEPQPDVRPPILVDQRATGLLGNYIVSLRGMGAIQKDSLRVDEDVSDRLLGDIRFSPPVNWTTSWGALKNAFSGIDFKDARRRLGVRLFSDTNSAMTCAATAYLARPTAFSWGEVERSLLDKEQTRLAKVTKPIIQIESSSLEAFGEMLRGRITLEASTRRMLMSRASAALDTDPFPSNWMSDNPLRLGISNALHTLGRGSDPATALLRLHISVTHSIRKNEPWILHLGEMPVRFQRWQPIIGRRDFRFSNLRTLVQQTRWRPHAF